MDDPEPASFVVASGFSYPRTLRKSLCQSIFSFTRAPVKYITSLVNLSREKVPEVSFQSRILQYVHLTLLWTKRRRGTDTQVPSPHGSILSIVNLTSSAVSFVAAVEQHVISSDRRYISFLRCQIPQLSATSAGLMVPSLLEGQ